MEDFRIVIVDDSAFSVAFIRDILEGNGFNVVGDASSLEEVKKAVIEKRPSLLTMDMTMPGTNGFECIRAAREIDRSVKVIIISSMKDEELVKAANKNNVSAYLQKPVDADELITAVKRVAQSGELYQTLKRECLEVFKEALRDTLNRTTKTMLTYEDSYPAGSEFKSAGVAGIVGIIGAFSGRMFIDLSKETAASLASAMFKRMPENNDEMMAALGEFTNIIAGNACSVLNRKNRALGLRVAPPSILSGEEVSISTPDFETATAQGQTDFGQLLLNVGFKEGEFDWM